MKKDKGDAYLCSWKRTKQGFSVWLIAEPSITVAAKDFDSAYEELWLLVCGQTGDGEAYLEFQPAPPNLRRFERFLDPYCITIDTNSVIDYPGNFSELFHGGVCPSCKSPVGLRNETALNLAEIPRTDECIVRRGRSSVLIYSYDLLLLLGLIGSPEIELRPVKLPPGTRKRYYEVVAAKGIMACGVKTFERMDITKGFRCKKCGMLQILYIVPKLAAHLFVPQAELPLSDVFLVQGSSITGDITICVRWEKWKRIAGKRGTKGVVAGLMGVVPKSEVLLHPKLKLA